MSHFGGALQPIIQVGDGWIIRSPPPRDLFSDDDAGEVGAFAGCRHDGSSRSPFASVARFTVSPASSSLHWTSAAHLRAQSIFMYAAWQVLQAARNCAINGLKSAARLARLASKASFEAVVAR